MTPSPAAALATLDQLHLLLDRLQDGRRHRGRDGAALAPMEERALRMVQQHPGCSQREFCMYSGRDKAQVTRIVQPLIARGLIAAVPDAADRRVQRLWLTHAGQAAHQQAAAARAELATRLLAGCGTAERQRLDAMVARLLDNLSPPAPA